MAVSNERVQKNVSNENVAPKKKKRRMKKQVRRTLGGLFLASALVVAAIPTPEIQAKVDQTEHHRILVASKHPTTDNPTDSTVTDKTFDSSIPFVSDVPSSRDAEKTVYTSEDGFFQFVYMRPTDTDPNKVAVILGYTGNESSLTIPDTLEGYKKYRDNDTSSGYCLVSKNNEYLHYETTKQKEEAGVRYYLVTDIMEGDHKKEVNENQCRYVDGKLVFVTVETRTITPTPFPEPTEDPVTHVTPEPLPVPTPYDEDYDVYHDVEPEMITVYEPCYNTTKSSWYSIPESDLFYSTDKVTFTQCGNESDHQRINADVAFIGQEFLVDNPSNPGYWMVSGPITKHGEARTDDDKGVFAFNKSLVNLTIGSNVRGVGDFAFYGCSNLQSVQFSSKLETVGNGAFAECINLQYCDIAYNANLLALGKDAFYNCAALRQFYTSTGLEAIGDSCFEGCSSLTNIYMCGENAPGGSANVALRYMGNHVFTGCKSLTSVTFPASYAETAPLDFDTFLGCENLQYVKVSNQTTSFDVIHKTKAADYPRCTGNDWTDVLKTLPASFYVEGPETSAIHEMCKNHQIAFKYLDSNPELYEIIKFEKDKHDTGDDRTAKVTYQIHTDGSIVKVIIEGDPVNLTIPETIGPYGIDTIGDSAFRDNCSLTKVTIPASCTSIGAYAFEGCHNLEVVTFTDATTMQSIGEDAFRTQECAYDVTGSGASKTIKCKKCNENLDSPTAKLMFCGAMLDPMTNTDTVPFAYAMNGTTTINNGDQSASWITYHSGWPTNMEVRYDYHYDPDKGENVGVVELVGYPRFEKYESVTTPYDTNPYLRTLPYITDDNCEYYGDLISTSVQAYNDYISGASTVPPTDKQMELINSALNIVVPSNVDAIKSGIFSGKDAEGNPAKDDDGVVIPVNSTVQTVTLNGVEKLDTYTFAGMNSLKNVGVIGPFMMGDYVFDEDPALTNVTFGTNLEDTGLRPFRGCTNMYEVECLGNNFRCTDGILYRATNQGDEIVECFEGRGDAVGSYTCGPQEFAGVVSIKPEAFMNCDGIGSVDLTSADVEVIPENCFNNMSSVNTIKLGSSVIQIKDDAFIDTTDLKNVILPYSLQVIAQDAFANKEDGSRVYPNSFNDTNHEQKKVYVSCVENSAADKYAKAYVYLSPQYGEVKITHLVYFYDDFDDPANPLLLKKEIVNDGENATPPDAPDHSDQGYTFTGWSNYTAITRDTYVYAKYQPTGDPYYTIKFVDHDGSSLGPDQLIQEGKNATPYEDEVKKEDHWPGHTFKGWEPQSYIGVYQDAIIVAQYKDNSGEESRHTVSFYSGYDNTLIGETKVNDGDPVMPPAAPAVAGYTFARWVPSDLSKITADLNVVAVYEKNTSPGPNPSSSTSPSPTPTNNPNGNANVKTFTVTVSGGSGTGSYAAGSIVGINAYESGTGQVFDKWMTATAGVGFANATSPSTYFVMPACNVAITATFKTGGGSSSSGGNSGNGGSSSNNGGTNSGSGNKNNNTGGTSVEVTKGGIYNTNVAGATVSGSTDNFVVKVTDDQNAADLALTALQNKFGDITQIKYLPMDISLYDSTGRTKIADTSGMSVSITLPLPNDLAQYAGNNRVASVTGGVIEDLNTRFTTVDGVPCVSFTATHFSPYVIYVDTANLTESTIDYTPKTGDPIHPKWFLSIGLAAVAIILFFKKDKKTKVVAA